MSKFLTLTLLIAIVTLTLSCSSSPEDERTDSPKSTGEIIDTYVKTLSTATDKAKEAAGSLDTHNEGEMKALEAIDAR